MRALVVAVALCALVAGGCGGGSEDGAAPTATPETAPSETSSWPRAPILAGVTLDGERLSLADFRGQPVLVNVWSSW